MTKTPASSELWNTKVNAGLGGLAGMGMTSLHHVHHAISNQVSDNIPAHLLNKLALGILVGAGLTAAVSALVNLSNQTLGMFE